MKDQAHSISLKADVDGFDTLVDLALNLRWSWSHGEEELWEPLDPELWEFTHNPWLVLLTTSLSRLKTLMAEPSYLRKVDEAARIKQEYLRAPTWFQQKYAESMTRETSPEPGNMHGCLYSVRVPARRPAGDYTPRLIPRNDEATVPLEAAQILWK